VRNLEDIVDNEFTRLHLELLKIFCDAAKSEVPALQDQHKYHYINPDLSSLD
jgi:hypothetical protein